MKRLVKNHSFKVGKADSLLLEQNGQYLLIDAGEEDGGEKITHYLQAQNITTLKALIITHYDVEFISDGSRISVND